MPAILSLIFYAYFFIGCLFAFWFVFFGAQKMDKGMEGAKLNLRLLLLPGAIIFWVILLPKYLKLKT